jgi:hypothetical protein
MLPNDLSIGAVALAAAMPLIGSAVSHSYQG